MVYRRHHACIYRWITSTIFLEAFASEFLGNSVPSLMALVTWITNCTYTIKNHWHAKMLIDILCWWVYIVIYWRYTRGSGVILRQRFSCTKYEIPYDKINYQRLEKVLNGWSSWRQAVLKVWPVQTIAVLELTDIPSYTHVHTHTYTYMGTHKIQTLYIHTYKHTMLLI